MKLLYEAPLKLYPPDKPAAYQASDSNHGHVVKSRKGQRQPERTNLSHAEILMGKTKRKKWRQHWFGLISKMWKHTLTGFERLWWGAQCEEMEFINYNWRQGRRTGFLLYMWFQMRCFDLHIERYIPFPTNASDFPVIFLPPWNPPVLEQATVTSAILTGQVTIRCLNKAPGDRAVIPWACFLRHPPVAETLGTKRDAWYHQHAILDGDYTNYLYDLSTIYPKIKPGTRAVLFHCYRNEPPGATITTDPTDFSAAAAIERGGIDWTDPANILDYNASVAHATDPTTWHSWQTDWITAQTVTWTPAIPDAAIILGIKLEFMSDSKPDTYAMRLQHIHLLKAGVPTTWYDNGAIVPQNQTFPWAYTPIGGPTKLWNTTWTGADLNDPLFGVQLYMQGYTALDPGIVEIAHVRITATYIDPQGGWLTPVTQTQFTFT